jgi:glyoxylase-like metal-dependent hydrolase (beta-lactamase superfamily II)
MLTGDTLFPGGFGRVDFPGGSPEQMLESLGRLARLEDGLAILPGHGAAGTIGDARPWLDAVVRAGRLPV